MALASRTCEIHPRTIQSMLASSVVEPFADDGVCIIPRGSMQQNLLINIHRKWLATVKGLLGLSHYIGIPLKLLKEHKETGIVYRHHSLYMLFPAKYVNSYAFAGFPTSINLNSTKQRETQGAIKIKLRRGNPNVVGGMVLTHLREPRLVTMPETAVLDAMHGLNHCPERECHCWALKCLKQSRKSAIQYMAINSMDMFVSLRRLWISTTLLEQHFETLPSHTGALIRGVPCMTRLCQDPVNGVPDFLSVTSL